MRTVKAEIIVDQRWLETFLNSARDRWTTLIDTDKIKITLADKEQIVDILEQAYQQDLAQQ